MAETVAVPGGAVIKKIQALQDGNSNNPPKIEKPKKTDKNSLDKAWSEIEKADNKKTAREAEQLSQYFKQQETK